MADCSYSRCVQERRNIRRELQKWTKNMVYIVGLERIAEELMGRRKWKLYQECMSRTQQQQQHLPINNNNNNTVLLDNGAKVNIVTTTVKREPSTTPQPAPHLQAEEEQDERDEKTQITTTIGAETAAATTPLTNTATTTTTATDIIEDEQERLKDWSPQSKCYFCVDGKLDSDHTQHGALSPRPSDSDSSDSPSDSEAPPTLIPPATGLQLLKNNHHHPAHHPNMTTIDASMASLAAVAALTGSGAGGQGAQMPFYPPAGLFATAPSWYLGSLARNFHQQQQQQQQQQERMEVVESKVNSAEQPLDLSSKPSNASTSANNNNTANCLENKLATNIRLPSLDTKHIFKAKPRMSAVAGRRTYTEEELQAALRDIQSGKLGTRRAAVIYGIPRSTLRNKVYKLAMERERETHLVAAVPIEDEGMDDDKELSGAEEEKEVEKALQGPLLSMDDIVRFSAIETPEAVKALLQQKHKDSSGAPDVWGGMEHSALGPYIQMLMSGQIAGAKDSDLMPMLPEIMRKIIAEEQHLNNGETTHEKLVRNSQPSPANSVKTERLKTDSSDMDTDDSPSNVILKIPSYKPTTSKNGGGDMYRSGASESGSIALSPPVMSESGSPPIMATANMMSLREAIAKSITEKLQQSPEPLKMHPEIDMKRVGFTPPLTAMPPVIKNHNHQSEPQTPPIAGSIVAAPTASLMHSRSYPPTTGGPGSGMNNNKQQQQQQSNNNSNSSQGGKGTRPKRGKYRNYDRDSLVEAVRAVQRGEMSVHRAGSYYGVPHSTLEYKVKERHLMRPRKRDPKPNPVDEKIASMKQQELRNSIPDKMKPAIKPPQKYPPTSPNGMKMPPMFDPTMAPIGYSPQPFPFWPHPSFPHLPLEYPRNPGTSQFPPNPEQFFASQMMQRLQEQSIRCHPDAAGASTAGGANSAASAAAIAKSAREMAESLYDGTGANGSFLDGIIRSSLESGVPVGADKLNNKEEKNVAPENMSNKALLDQLCRNSRITPLPLPKPSVNVDPNSSGDESYRKTSPLNFTKNSSKDRDSPIGLSYKNDTRDDIQTIELSNDSNDSSSTKDEDSPAATSVLVKNSNQSPPPRIYVKPQFQELTKPENLKPEVMVRFRADSVVHQSLPSPPHDHDDLELMTERNGIIEIATATGSASEHKPDVAQD